MLLVVIFLCAVFGRCNGICETLTDTETFASDDASETDIVCE